MCVLHSGCYGRENAFAPLNTQKKWTNGPPLSILHGSIHVARDKVGVAKSGRPSTRPLSTRRSFIIWGAVSLRFPRFFGRVAAGYVRACGWLHGDNDGNSDCPCCRHGHDAAAATTATPTY